MDARDPDAEAAGVVAEALVARVVAARFRLGEAAASADSHAVAEALDELEEALGLARESGVAVPRADPAS
jgi:hypothetical protein